MLDLFDSWLYRLFVNFSGYFTILLPLYLAVWFYKEPQERTNWYNRIIAFCVHDREKELLPSSSVDASDIVARSKERAPSGVNSSVISRCLLAVPERFREAVKLLFCVLGLQACYITWGYYQERVMTIRYSFSNAKSGSVNSASNEQLDAGEYFKDSQFLVFANRIGAVLLSGAVLLIRACLRGSTGEEAKSRAATYKYSLPSLSNTLSSWFQYEALKYVSFPTQVICKSAKVVATMCMNKVVSHATRVRRERRVTYSKLEWVTAFAIAMGICLFLLGSEYEDFKGRTRKPIGKAESANTWHAAMVKVSGGVILIGYLAADSFTTTYQSSLFKNYGMSSVTMMFATNAFSFACCGASLFWQSAFGGTWRFVVAHPDFLVHVSAIALTSAIGQLFIFYTIDQFGAVTFALIMTARQAFSIVVSCIAFGHPVTLLGWFGLTIAVAATLVRTDFSRCARTARSAAKAPPTDNAETATPCEPTAPLSSAATPTATILVN